jgi:murein DD-endopeptidase MepM/ murein hydrolase activator NlpD
MMQGLVCILFVLGVACVDRGDIQIEGKAADTAVVTLEAELLPNEHLAPPPTHQLPFMSGERYTATTYAGHTGWDFNMLGDCGQPVVSAEAGTVVAISTSCPEWSSPGCGGGYGNYVKIRHNDGYYSLYAHLQTSQVFVRVGQGVERGQSLGKLGTSGDSTGCHLHYEVRDSADRWLLPNFIWDGGSGGLSNGSSYTSKNQGKLDSMRNMLGAGNVGNQMTPNATRVHADGFSLTYNGGAWGENTMYYEALGCGVVPYCTVYNNSNYAWNVRGAIRAKYFAIGGPNSSLSWPTGNEYPTAQGSRQNFKCGYITWKSATGMTTHTFTGCP